MELVETVRDVEAVLHCQGCVVGVGGGRTGMVGNDERFSDLIGGLYTPPGLCELVADQVGTDANESPEDGVKRGRARSWQK